MRQSIMLVVAIVFAVSFSVAQGTDSVATKATNVTLKGYVVDQMCAKGMAKKSNPMVKAASHTKECALEDNCAPSGYGIFSDGKYYKFDTDGSKQAKALIEKDKREKKLAYEVTGASDGTTLKVVTMKATTIEDSGEKK